MTTAVPMSSTVYIARVSRCQSWVRAVGAPHDLRPKMALSTERALFLRSSLAKMAMNAMIATTTGAPAPRNAATTDAGLKVATPSATARLRTLRRGLLSVSPPSVLPGCF